MTVRVIYKMDGGEVYNGAADMLAITGADDGRGVQVHTIAFTDEDGAEHELSYEYDGDGYSVELEREAMVDDSPSMGVEEIHEEDRQLARAGRHTHGWQDRNGDTPA